METEEQECQLDTMQSSSARGEVLGITNKKQWIIEDAFKSKFKVPLGHEVCQQCDEEAHIRWPRTSSETSPEEEETLGVHLLCR